MDRSQPGGIRIAEERQATCTTLSAAAKSLARAAYDIRGMRNLTARERAGLVVLRHAIDDVWYMYNLLSKQVE